jgi:hypothetical protein
MQGSTFKRSLLAVTLIAALGAGYAKLGGQAISPADAVPAATGHHHGHHRSRRGTGTAVERGTAGLHGDRRAQRSGHRQHQFHRPVENGGDDRPERSDVRVLPPLRPALAARRGAGARHGVGLHRQHGRADPDQRARRRRCRRGHRQAHRQARIQGQGGRPRQADRRGRPAHQRRQSAGRSPRRSIADTRRRMGPCHRFAVRLREQRHGRYRLGEIALAGQRQLRALHPDRRSGQSGQFRRPAAQPGRRGDRHQLANLQPQRRLSGRLVRHSDQRRAQRPGAVAAAWQGPPRPPRRQRFRRSRSRWPNRSD